MKITEVVTQVHTRPPSADPIRDAIQTLPGAGEVVVRITHDEGVSGTGSAFYGRISGGPEVLGRVIETQLKPLLLGQDPFPIRAIRDRLVREMDYHGTTGIAAFAISAIDIALWDLLGRTLEQPVAHLLGQQHDRVPAYAMVGWLNYDLPKLEAICAQAVEQGYRAVKIKVGSATLAEDVARVRAVRRAVGEQVRIFVDANQAFDVSEALERGRAYQDEGCWWYEEPLRADQIEGLAELRRRLDIRVASGENNYRLSEFKQMLVQGSVDILQADLRRAGGATAILEIANLAHAFAVPYASHAQGGVQLHLMAAMPNACYLESGLLSKAALHRLVDGCMLVPSGPGFSTE